MPQAAIKALRRIGPLLDPDRAKDVPMMLNSVEGIPLYKLFLIYETPWWKEKCGLEDGRSITDIPVRQCYYWSTKPGAPSAIMAYNDQASTSFWGGYQTGPLGPWDAEQVEIGPTLFKAKSSDWIAPEDKIAERRRRNWDMHKAPHDMVMEMHRQLLEMHQVEDVPEPIDAAFMDWMNFPYGGAVHFWNPGYKSWEMLEKIPQPVEGLNVFIVGEAYSTVQTWVEGAFQTSEIALGKLGMNQPNWLKTEPTA
jgi:monoamine oxidase